MTCCNDSASGSVLFRKKRHRRREVTHFRCVLYSSGGAKARVHCATAVSVALAFFFFRAWSPADFSRDSGTASSGAPLSAGVAYGLKGAATLLLRSSGAVGGRDEPPDVQAFELTHLSHPHHVPTLRSALVDRAAQNGIYGPIFSMCIGL